MTRDRVTSRLVRVAPRSTQRARDAKHRAHRWWWFEKLERKSQLLNLAHRTRPYRYDRERYYNTFLAYDAPPDRHHPQSEAPRRIWCAWTGDNALTPNRHRGLDSIRRANPDTEVVLVTPHNLDSFVLPDYPLHPIYDYLSLVHRSDYLRCYLMHHYGGAYTDIKVQRGSMTDAIDQLNASADTWVVAGPQPSMPAAIDGESWLDRECRHRFAILPSGGAFAVRAGTALTLEWYAEVHRRADYFLDLAREHPGGVWGLCHPNVTETDYPIHWNVLQANVFEPLCLKYHDHIQLHERFRPELGGHR